MAHLTIGKKLFLSLGTMVLFTFILGVTALVSINSINDHLHEIVDSRVKKQTIAHGMRADTAELTGLPRAIILRAMMRDDVAQNINLQNFAAAYQRLNASIDNLNAMQLTPEMRQELKDFKEEMDTLPPAKEEILEAFKAGDISTATGVLDGKIGPTEKRLDEEIDKILKLQDQLFASDSEAATATANTSRWITTILLGLTLIVAAIVVFVVRKINSVLASSVKELAQSSEQIAAAASQVSSSSQSQAQGSSEQAATIEETSSVSVEINSMAQRNTENSKQTADIVTGSEAGFQRANNSLSEMVVAMEGISNSSQKISKIIKVIDEIAFQTNILALNAAVEAARAGEAGMGFAVVADEVRSLAQRCAQAAKDTTDLIEDSIQKSDGGKLKVDQVAVAIREITAQSAQIKTLVDEINLGSIEQSRGIDQISTSIGQMEQVTQSSAANAEETAATAEELSAQAKTMKEVVARLKRMVQNDSESSESWTAASPVPTRINPHPGARGSVSKVKTTLRSSRPAVRTNVTASVTTKSPAVAAGVFPMDDDFKEF